MICGLTGLLFVYCKVRIGLYTGAETELSKVTSRDEALMRRNLLLAMGITIGTSPLDCPPLLATTGHTNTALTATTSPDRATLGSREQLARRLVEALEAESPEHLAWQEVKALRHDLELARAFIAEERDFFRRREGQLLTAKQMLESRTQQMEGRLAEVNKLIEVLEKQLHETSAELQRHRFAADIREGHLKQSLVASCDSVSVLQVQREQAEANLREATEKLAYQQNQITTLGVQLSTLESQRTELQGALQLAQNDLAHKRAEAEQLRKNLWIAQESLSAAKEDYSELAHSFMALQQVKEQLGEDLSALSELALHYLSMVDSLDKQQSGYLSKPYEVAGQLYRNLQAHHDKLQQLSDVLLGDSEKPDSDQARMLVANMLSSASSQRDQIELIQQELLNFGLERRRQLSANRVFLTGLTDDLERQLTFQPIGELQGGSTTAIQALEQTLQQRLHELGNMREKLANVAACLQQADVPPNAEHASSVRPTPVVQAPTLAHLSLPQYLQVDLENGLKSFKKELSKLEVTLYDDLEAGSASRTHLLHLAKDRISALITQLRTQGEELLYDRCRLAHLQDVAEKQLAANLGFAAGLTAELEQKEDQIEQVQASAAQQKSQLTMLQQLLVQTKAQLDEHCDSLNLCLQQLEQHKGEQASLRHVALAAEVHKLFSDQSMLRAAERGHTLEQELRHCLDRLAAREQQVEQLGQQLHDVEQHYGLTEAALQTAQQELAAATESNAALEAALSISESRQQELAAVVAELRGVGDQLGREVTEVVELAGRESAARLHASNTLQTLTSSYMALAEHLEESYSHLLLDPVVDSVQEDISAHSKTVLALENQLLQELSSHGPVLEDVLTKYREKFRSLLATVVAQQEQLVAYDQSSQRQRRASLVMLEQLAAELERRSDVEAVMVHNSDLRPSTPRTLHIAKIVPAISLELPESVRSALEGEAAAFNAQLEALVQSIQSELAAAGGPDSVLMPQVEERIYVLLEAIARQGQQILDLRSKMLLAQDEGRRQAAAHQGIESILVAELDQAVTSTAKARDDERAMGLEQQLALQATELDGALDKLSTAEALLQNNVLLRQQAEQELAQLASYVTTLERLNSSAPLIWQAVLEDLQLHYQDEVAALKNALEAAHGTGDAHALLEGHKEGALLEGWIAGSQSAIAQRMLPDEALAEQHAEQQALERQMKAQRALMASLESHLQHSEEAQQLMARHGAERDRELAQAVRHNQFLQQHLDLADRLAVEAYEELSEQRLALSEQAEDLQDAVSMAKDELLRAKERFAQSEHQISELQEQLVQERLHAERLHAELTELKAGKEAELALLSQRISDTERAGLAEIVNLSEQLAHKEKQLELHQRDMEELQLELAQTMQELHSVGALAALSAERAKSYEDQLLEARAQISTMGAELIEQAASVASRDAELADLLPERDDLRESLGAMERLLGESMAQVAAREASLRRAQLTYEQSEQLKAELISRLTALQGDAAEQSHSYQLLEQRYDDAMASLLQVAEERDESQQALAAAQEEHQKIANELKLHSAALLAERDSLEDRLLEQHERITECEQIIAGVQCDLEESHMQAQALREQLLTAQYKHQDDLSQLLAERDTLRYELEQQMQQLGDSVAVAEGYHHELVAKDELSRIEHDQHLSEVSTLKRTIDAHQATVSHMAAALDDSAAEIQDRRVLLSRLESAQASGEQSEARAQELAAVIARLEAALRFEQARNVELEKYIESANSN